MDIVKEPAGNVGVEQHTFHAELLDASVQFGLTGCFILERQNVQAKKPVRMLRHETGDVVVEHLGHSRAVTAKPFRPRVIGTERAAADAVGIHIGQQGILVAMIWQHFPHKQTTSARESSKITSSA